MEVFVDSIQSALSGFNAGASKVIICYNICEGGTTPTVGMLRVIKQNITKPVHVIIRPINGPCVYTEHELDIMKQDIKLFKEHGADGFVFGVTTADERVDASICKILVQLASPLPVTFNGSFDSLKDPLSELETIIACGFHRVLSRGREDTAERGLRFIKELIRVAGNRIVIVPFGGINEFNVTKILKDTNVTEFCSTGQKIVTLQQDDMLRLSGGHSTKSELDLLLTTTCDFESVQRIVKLSNAVFFDRRAGRR